MVFSELKERFDGDTAAPVTKAVVVLFIGLGLVVFRMEAAKAVEDAAAGFSKVVGEGETEVEPGFVGVGDINAGVFDAANDDVYVVGAFLELRRWLGLRLF